MLDELRREAGEISNRVLVLPEAADPRIDVNAFAVVPVRQFGNEVVGVIHSESLTCLLRTLRGYRCLDVRGTTRSLPLLNIFEDRSEVESKLRGVCFSRFPHFINHRIIVSAFDFLVHDAPRSCSGVMIRGDTYPLARHARSILLARLALARCRQFHVSRKSMA